MSKIPDKHRYVDNEDDDDERHDFISSTVREARTYIRGGPGKQYCDEFEITFHTRRELEWATVAHKTLQKEFPRVRFHFTRV